MHIHVEPKKFSLLTTRFAMIIESVFNIFNT